MIFDSTVRQGGMLVPTVLIVYLHDKAGGTFKNAFSVSFNLLCGVVISKKRNGFQCYPTVLVISIIWKNIGVYQAQSH